MVLHSEAKLELPTAADVAGDPAVARTVPTALVRMADGERAPGRRGRCVAHREGPARLDGEARPRGGDEQFERRFARGGRPDAPIAEIAM